MKRIALLLLPLLAVSAFAQSQPSTKLRASAPIKDFRLPTFDKNGNREAYLRAGEALFVTSDQIDVKDLQYTSFTKDGTGAFDSVLIAPTATFRKDKRTASGKDMVRLIRVNLEVSGEQWSYDHDAQRVVIEKNAKVIFQDEIKAIIK